MASGIQNSGRSWNRIDGIDLLRGLAIFFVLMNHVNMRLFGAHVPYTRGIPKQLVHALVWNGQLGVQIFFVISGFLITSITLRRWGPLQRVNVRDFYLLRFARIAPLLFLLLVVLSALHFAHVQDFVVSAKTGGLGRAIFAALTFHVNVLEASRGYLPGSWDVLWSLSVEETFYFFFPLIARLLGRGKVLIALLVGFAMLGPLGRTVLSHGNPVWREYSYLGGMDAIALGCLTALVVSRVKFSRAALRVFAAAGISLLLLILDFSVEPFLWMSLGRHGLEESILAIGTSLIIIAAVQTQWTSPRILRPLLRIGRNSYEIYLTHMFVVFALFDLFLKWQKRLALVPVLFIVTIVLASVLGEFVARSYSEPMNRALRARWGEGANRLGSAMDTGVGEKEKVVAT
jgi:peptidoglycan/LPS O-acetylase OafA/YrhL